jgi:hypothetical protein
MHVQAGTDCTRHSSAFPSGFRDLVAACQQYRGHLYMRGTDMPFCDAYNPPEAMSRPSVYVITGAPRSIPVMRRLQEILAGMLPQNKSFWLEKLDAGRTMHATAVALQPWVKLGARDDMVRAWLHTVSYPRQARLLYNLDQIVVPPGPDCALGPDCCTT